MPPAVSMSPKNSFTKIAIIGGTILVWFPLVAPVGIGIIFYIAKHQFLFDYLMPAELSLVALGGGGLLLWAAWRTHSRGKLIGWGFGLAIAFLVGGQALAVVTGLASGEIAATGWPWWLVLASLGIYSLAVLAMGVGGVLLWRDLWRGK